MQPLKKYQFHIKTKSGITVNPISISAANQLAAEQNLFQMYRGCQIIDVSCDQQTKVQEMDYQDILNLIINS